MPTVRQLLEIHFYHCEQSVGCWFGKRPLDSNFREKTSRVQSRKEVLSIEEFPAAKKKAAAMRRCKKGAAKQRWVVNNSEEYIKIYYGKYYTDTTEGTCHRWTDTINDGNQSVELTLEIFFRRVCTQCVFSFKLMFVLFVPANFNVLLSSVWFNFYTHSSCWNVEIHKDLQMLRHLANDSATLWKSGLKSETWRILKLKKNNNNNHNDKHNKLTRWYPGIRPTWLTLAGVRIMSRTPDQPAITPVGTA